MDNVIYVFDERKQVKGLKDAWEGYKVRHVGNLSGRCWVGVKAYVTCGRDMRRAELADVRGTYLSNGMSTFIYDHLSQ